MVSTLENDPRKRFSRRAEYYSRYRPSYPKSLLSYLEQDLCFSQASVVADVGSGTGILSKLLLENGNIVFGVEPNGDMRRTAEANLAKYPNYRSIGGSAESTTLEDGSVDFITAGQSFHWFNPEQAKAEFRRVLRREGWVVLIWNTRRTSTPFLQAYDALVSWIPDNQRARHEDLGDQAFRSFLGDYRAVKLDNSQELDYEGLVGRLLSSSYAPLRGEPLFDEMITKVTDLFNRHQVDGVVTLDYVTEVYAGQLG
ncbi:MAG: methyltransferase domain-containing protein [Candidatus Bathyarchaeia archaeon]